MHEQALDEAELGPLEPQHLDRELQDVSRRLLTSSRSPAPEQQTFREADAPVVATGADVVMPADAVGLGAWTVGSGGVTHGSPWCVYDDA